MSKKIPIIIDTDPGIDDAMALVILSNHLDKFDIKLITSCCGNTPIEVTTRNVQFLAKNFFNGVRIAKGSAAPLAKNFVDASEVHGKSGLGAYEIGEQDYPVEEDAVESIYNVLTNSNEKINIVTLGPLTNIAKLVTKYPDSINYVDKVYSMIGSVAGTGNITKFAEFNSYVDPEAFDIVVKSGLSLILNTIEIGNTSRTRQSSFAVMDGKSFKDGFIKTIALSIEETLGAGWVNFYDPNTIMALIYPNLFNFVKADAVVDISDEKRGMCVMTKNENGQHYYQEIKNVDLLTDKILEELNCPINIKK